MTVFAQVLGHVEILKAIQVRVHVDQARFDTYEPIDSVIVLIDDTVISEPTLKAYYERLAPSAEPFVVLFGQNQLPHRSTLSQCLVALD